MGLFNRTKPTPPPVFEQLHREPVPVLVAKPKGKGIAGILGNVPIIGELFQIGPLIPQIADIFKDKSGRMSSKRFGAGAFTTAGIVLVSDGSASGNSMQFWGGIALCAMGVVLFGMTKWEPGNDNDDTTPDPA